MRTLGVAVAASLAMALAAPTAARTAVEPPNYSYTYRILNNPTTGDAFMFRGALQGTASKLAGKLFTALAPELGGTAPALNFVPTGSPMLSDGDSSANVRGQTGFPQGTVNVSPAAVEGLINNSSPYHSSAVTLMPHEFAHLRQTAQTLAQILTREGGAQAFADLFTPQAAKQAGIPYTPGNYDGAYAPYVQAVQQPPYGQGWISAAQFGH